MTHDDRGAYVIIGASPYVAFAIHGEPAHLARYTRDPDGSITLHPVGQPFTRLDLAVDAGHWYAERHAYADTAEHECRRCGNPIRCIDGIWVAVDYTSTAGGLSCCPPDPDAQEVGNHIPRKRDRR